jgi:hypothetical protein
MMLHQAAASKDDTSRRVTRIFCGNATDFFMWLVLHRIGDSRLTPHHGEERLNLKNPPHALCARAVRSACATYAFNGGHQMTTWQKPEFTEVSMNAEIGSYQEDFGGRGNVPPRTSKREDLVTHDPKAS